MTHLRRIIIGPRACQLGSFQMLITIAKSKQSVRASHTPACLVPSITLSSFELPFLKPEVSLSRALNPIGDGTYGLSLWMLQSLLSSALRRSKPNYLHLVSILFMLPVLSRVDRLTACSLTIRWR